MNDHLVMTSPDQALVDYRPLLRRVAGTGLAALSWAVTGVRPIWQGSAPDGRQRIYFANHSSHGDFILLASCLPPALRERTVAVAAADYWRATRLRRFIAEDMLRTVLVDRNWAGRSEDPMAVMLDALDKGFSLIIFPEGTRNMTEEPLLRFRSGLYNLANQRPGIELVPCWIENMSRVLPKGALLPVPLLCRVIFGAGLRLGEGEERGDFLGRAHGSLRALDPRLARNAA